MESLLLGLLVAALVWLAMRHHRLSRSRRPSARAAPEQRTMPRLGKAGTVTPAQLERLKAFHFEPSSDYSREEADLILDSVVYLRAAIERVTGERQPPEDVQNEVLVFILSDAALRQHLLEWGAARRTMPVPRQKDLPLHSAEFERVAGFIRQACAAPGRGR